MFLKVSKGTIAYDASLAKSKVPFASTIATFRRRSFKPVVVVYIKTFHTGFSADAQVENRAKGKAYKVLSLGQAEDVASGQTFRYAFSG